MKNTKLLLVIFLFLSVILNAQGRRVNQSSIHAQYGYVLDKDSLTGGFMAKAGYGRVMGNKGFLGKVEGFYQSYKVEYRYNQILPYKKYGIGVYGGYSYEGLAPVFFNVYGGVYGAYEMVNDGNERDPKFNALIPAKVKGFVYGLSGSAELEIILVRKLSLVADYTQYYDLKSEFSKSNFALFGGLKYYIN
ncbi:hypothetical protein [Chryseobacterium sp. SL1]|uniref:hypothetical protein n=1 Tax=Chryseobacterium sp. SL1 TaxID=2995159 RepID=UPI002272580F|nr:hypothetical protein [Chryseobacterium sp. SL1]MCY1659308.1 hypothetical protein [Chryseobacterium sp. SL1]